MTELTKRSLRQRRVPRNFDSDNEDVDPYGYSKHSYSRDNRNPTLQLNSDAKLLVRFITSVNKCISTIKQGHRDYEQDMRKKEIDSIKQPLPIRGSKPKTAQLLPEQLQRSIEVSKEGKLQSRKGRELYNFKAQVSNSDSARNLRKESFLNKIKNMTLESASSMINLERILGKDNIQSNDNSKNQFFNMQMPPKIGKIYEETAKQGNGVTINGAKKTQSDQSKNVFYSRDKDKLTKIQQIEQRFGIPKSNFNEAKLFKRASYHVGIAYHIYFKKMKEKGITGSQLDPTYYAKKLKEDINKST